MTGTPRQAAGKPSRGGPRPLCLTGCVCLCGSSTSSIFPQWDRVGLSPSQKGLRTAGPWTTPGGFLYWESTQEGARKGSLGQKMPPLMPPVQRPCWSPSTTPTPTPASEQAALGTGQGLPPQLEERALPCFPRLTNAAQQLTDTAAWFLTEINIHVETVSQDLVYPAAL